ncbi:MAG: hypothetical protein ACFCVE_10555 [Phycisphaerae bacterium]
MRPTLEITYRNGKPLAAYLYTGRHADRVAARSEAHGVFVADFDAAGDLIGVEIPTPTPGSSESLLKLLSSLHVQNVTPHDLAPLNTAA